MDSRTIFKWGMKPRLVAIWVAVALAAPAHAAQMIFQEGLNGYEGSFGHAIGRDHVNPMRPGSGANVGEAYVHWHTSVLLKFTNVVGGTNPLTTIPPGANITKATLRLWKNYNAGVNDDNEISVYKMLKDWSTLGSDEASLIGWADGTSFIYERGKDDRWTDAAPGTEPMNAEAPFPDYFGRKVTVESNGGDSGQTVVIWGRKRDSAGVQDFIIDKSVVLSGATPKATIQRFGWVDGAMISTGVPNPPFGDVIIKEEGTGIELMRIKAGQTSTSVADRPEAGRGDIPVAYHDGTDNYPAPGGSYPQQMWYEFDVTTSFLEQVASGQFYGWLFRHDEPPLNSGGGPYLDWPASTVQSTRPQLIVEFTGVDAVEIINLDVSTSGTNITVQWDTVDAETGDPLSATTAVQYGTTISDYPFSTSGVDGTSHSITFDAAHAVNPIDGVIHLQAISTREGYVPGASEDVVIDPVHIGLIRTPLQSPLAVSWRSDVIGAVSSVDYGPTSTYGSTVAASTPEAPIKYSEFGGAKQVWIPAGAFSARSMDEGSADYAADAFAHYPLSNATYKFYTLQASSPEEQRDWWAQYEIPVTQLPGTFNFSGVTWYFHARASQSFSSGSDSDWLIVNGHATDLDVAAPGEGDWLTAAMNADNADDRILNALGALDADAYRWSWVSDADVVNDVLTTAVQGKRFRIDNNKAVFRVYEREASTRNASIDYMCWSSSPSYVPTDEDCLNATPVAGTTPSETFKYVATIPGVDPGETVHFRVKTTLADHLAAVSDDQVFQAPSGGVPNSRLAGWQQGYEGYSGGQDAGVGTPGTGGESSPSGGSAYISCTPAGQGIIEFAALTLPSDAVVEEAALRLFGNYSAYRLPFRPWVSIYQLLAQGWDASVSTWFKKNADEPWSLNGALGAGVDIGWASLDTLAEFDNPQNTDAVIQSFDITNAIRKARSEAGGGSNAFAVAFRLNPAPDNDPTTANGWDWYWSHDVPDGTVAGYAAGKYKRPVLVIKYRSSLPPQTLGELKDLPYGLPISVSGAVVTAETFPSGQFYIEAPDRSSGIAVESTAIISRWDKVNVEGTIGILPNGEPVIREASVTLAGSQELAPLAMGNKAVAANKVSGKGAESAGLLVRTWGTVTFADIDPDTGESFFYVDDGSGIVSDGGNIGVKVYSATSFPTIGGFVTVTGIASYELDGSVPIPVILTRDFDDVIE